MEPNIINRSTVFISSLPYLFSMPKKNDIIVFKKNNKHFLKRIFKISKDKYFVRGDNKSDSLDSRKIGPILKKQIIGKVIYKI